MEKPRESSKAALVVVVLLLIPLLIGGSYVAAYFVCSGLPPWHSERYFANESQYNFFHPLVRIERGLRGKDFAAGHSLQYVAPAPAPIVLLANSRDWTASDGREFVAEFVERTEHNVRLRTVAGETTVPLDSLSEQDREWVEGR